MIYAQFKAIVFPDIPASALRYGAPLGRADRMTRTPNEGRMYDRIVPINRSGYDHGGAYWGYVPGDPLRCRFTASGEYRVYYRISKVTAINIWGHCYVPVSPAWDAEQSGYMHGQQDN